MLFFLKGEVSSMKRYENSERHNQIMRCLCHLPRKLVELHEHENLPEFVLNDLCHASCFNLTKAAYFVDNPEFNFVKGIVGYYRPESYPDHAVAWEDTQSFSLHMESSPFNQQVRTFIRPSIKRGNHVHADIVRVIAEECSLRDPLFFSWNMKHGNHGLFVFQEQDLEEDGMQEHLSNAVHYLSLCPIF